MALENFVEIMSEVKIKAEEICKALGELYNAHPDSKYHYESYEYLADDIDNITYDFNHTIKLGNGHYEEETVEIPLNYLLLPIEEIIQRETNKLNDKQKEQEERIIRLNNERKLAYLRNIQDGLKEFPELKDEIK